MLIKLLEQLIASKKTSPQELATLLIVSKDTIYKRLHRTSAFTIDEVFILQQHFGFSIDAMAPKPLAMQKMFITKEFELLDTPQNTMANYINKLLADFTQLGTLGAPHLYYAAKDLPLFCFFSSPVLTSFKLYFWYITIFDAQATHIKYSNKWLSKDILDKANMLYQMYNNIPSTEIWNTETINSTLHQIEYAFTTGLISKKDAIEILDALRSYIDKLRQHATDENKANGVAFNMYLNEILLLDNSVLFEIGSFKLFYLPYQTLNFINTSDAIFTNKVKAWYNKQISKSILISGNAQRDRLRLINMYLEAIDKVERHL
jgi:plasmid maintenance system antidote protein VapI